MKIKTLTLYTNQLQAQVAFYAQTLGFPLVEHTSTTATFSMGTSLLVFEVAKHSTPYHFAFNIPSNQEKDALDWLKARTTVLGFEGQDIQDFPNWNAKAIYFYDADRNIVEFIARKQLNNEQTTRFGPSSVSEISEIGMPVNDISVAYQELQSVVELPVYDGDMGRFCAIGDEHGLFICVNKNQKDWFPTGDKTYSSPFVLELEERGTPFALVFTDGHLRATTT